MPSKSTETTEVKLSPLQQFKELILSNKKKTKVAILMHENPDPDSIASALGLARVMSHWNKDIKCSFLYSGTISHSQNKTMVNVLNVSLTHKNEIESLEEFADIFVTVDVLPERCLPKDIECSFVVDHHKDSSVLAKIQDIRRVGAASSIVWDYLNEEGIKLDKGNEIDALLATALLIGVKTDTVDLVSDNVTDLDFRAYQSIMGCVDRAKLSAIINYPIPFYQFELRSVLDNKDNYKTDNGVFVGGIGHIAASKRDVLPTLAAERSRLAEIQTAFVFAVIDNDIHVSIRTINPSVDINSVCHKIFGKSNSGGKLGAAAAKIPLGFLGLDSSASDEVVEKQWSFIKTLIIDRVFHVINNV